MKFNVKTSKKPNMKFKFNLKESKKLLKEEVEFDAVEILDATVQGGAVEPTLPARLAATSLAFLQASGEAVVSISHYYKFKGLFEDNEISFPLLKSVVEEIYSETQSKIDFESEEFHEFVTELLEEQMNDYSMDARSNLTEELSYEMSRLTQHNNTIEEKMSLISDLVEVAKSKSEDEEAKEEAETLQETLGEIYNAFDTSMDAVSGVSGLFNWRDVQQFYNMSQKYYYFLIDALNDVDQFVDIELADELKQSGTIGDKIRKNSKVLRSFIESDFNETLIRINESAEKISENDFTDDVGEAIVDHADEVAEELLERIKDSGVEVFNIHEAIEKSRAYMRLYGSVSNELRVRTMNALDRMAKELDLPFTEDSIEFKFGQQLGEDGILIISGGSEGLEERISTLFSDEISWQSPKFL